MRTVDIKVTFRIKGEYEARDCRIMIGQQFGLKYLVPLALEILEDNILVDGGLYSGDLIDAFLNVDKKFWRENKEWYNETIGLIDKAVEKLNVIKRKMVYD